MLLGEVRRFFIFIRCREKHLIDQTSSEEFSNIRFHCIIKRSFRSNSKENEFQCFRRQVECIINLYSKDIQLNTIKHYQVKQITEEHLNKGSGDDKVIIIK